MAQEQKRDINQGDREGNENSRSGMDRKESKNRLPCSDSGVCVYTGQSNNTGRCLFGARSCIYE